MLRNEDTFRVECVNSISEDSIVSLANLYQPLIGGDGLLLYLTLHAEARHQRAQATHKHLCRIMNNISLDTLERARLRLEEYNLLRAYMRQGSGHDAWIYHLNTPLPTMDFLSNQIYLSRFRNEVGAKDTDEIVARLGNVGLSLQGYKDVTRQIRTTPVERTMPEPAWTTVRPRYQFSSGNEKIDFDYERFLATTSAAVFPIVLRTQENMALIGRLGTVYGISADRMRQLIANCTVPDPAFFNADKLKLMCKKEKVQTKNTHDPYSLPPVSFLQSLMNGREVPLAEKKILENLSTQMHFSNEVINVLIAYVLKISDNRLSARFVSSVAAQWARDGIETKEQALLEAKKNLHSSRSYQKVELPAYMNKPLPESKPASEQLVQKVKAMQQEMKKHDA